jgi:hypothetical protein
VSNPIIRNPTRSFDRIRKSADEPDLGSGVLGYVSRKDVERVLQDIAGMARNARAQLS